MKMAKTAHHEQLRNSSDRICFENNDDDDDVKDTKALVSELCRNFYTLGWVSGTGGSVSIKVLHQENVLNKSHQLIVMSPSGVQKERMVPEDMFVLCSDGSVLFRPLPKPYPHHIPQKYTDCAVLFLKIYEMRNAGAVIHSHAMESCIVTMIDPFSKEFHMMHMEMIKGIQGHSYHDKLVVPIIENASHEAELLGSLTEAIIAYPKSNAILVRNHGVFIWGDTWISAKTQAECYHYLFGAALKLHQLGLNPFSCNRSIGNVCVFRNPARNGHNRRPPLSLDSVLKPLQRFILLDMMTATIWSSSIPLKHAASYKDAEMVDMVGHIVSDEVPQALQKWHSSGIKVYIYSSHHSRVTQSQFFGKSDYGDLRKYLCGYFDTTMRCKTKVTTSYYTEISETVGVEKPSDMLFVTETLDEALGARAAGMEVVIWIRSGTEPSIYKYLGIRTIKSLLELS